MVFTRTCHSLYKNKVATGFYCPVKRGGLGEDEQIPSKVTTQSTLFARLKLYTSQITTQGRSIMLILNALCLIMQNETIRQFSSKPRLCSAETGQKDTLVNST